MSDQSGLVHVYCDHVAGTDAGVFSLYDDVLENVTYGECFVTAML